MAEKAEKIRGYDFIHKSEVPAIKPNISIHGDHIGTVRVFVKHAARRTLGELAAMLVPDSGRCIRCLTMSWWCKRSGAMAAPTARNMVSSLEEKASRLILRGVASPSDAARIRILVLQCREAIPRVFLSGTTDGEFMWG